MCRFSAVEEYQVLITREDPADAYSPDKLVVRVATLTDNRDLLADQIIREIKNACEVKPVVEFADADAIYDAAAAAKARRIVDGRPRSE
jgi:phenylacetate-coenzyme A ligase PaaK-like adenylate-forming protein